jgi:hypothetical protein
LFKYYHKGAGSPEIFRTTKLPGFKNRNMVKKNRAKTHVHCNRTVKAGGRCGMDRVFVYAAVLVSSQEG